MKTIKVKIIYLWNTSVSWLIIRNWEGYQTTYRVNIINSTKRKMGVWYFGWVQLVEKSRNKRNSMMMEIEEGVERLGKGQNITI